jgi:hypothetical protein
LSKKKIPTPPNWGEKAFAVADVNFLILLTILRPFILIVFGSGNVDLLTLKHSLLGDLCGMVIIMFIELVL